MREWLKSVWKAAARKTGAVAAATMDLPRAVAGAPTNQKSMSPPPQEPMFFANPWLLTTM